VCVSLLPLTLTLCVCLIPCRYCRYQLSQSGQGALEDLIIFYPPRKNSLCLRPLSLRSHCVFLCVIPCRYCHYQLSRSGQRVPEESRLLAMEEEQEGGLNRADIQVRACCACVCVHVCVCVCAHACWAFSVGRWGETCMCVEGCA
jgi:hypothetical protein